MILSFELLGGTTATTFGVCSPTAKTPPNAIVFLQFVSHDSTTTTTTDAPPRVADTTPRT